MYKIAFIIDDSPLERLLAERIIRNAEFAADVKTFNSAVDALNFIQSQTDVFPDVIMVDIQMPVMTGFDFLDEYQRLPEHMRQSKIIMLSSTLADEDYVRIKKYPIISAFLPKPLNAGMFSNLAL